MKYSQNNEDLVALEYFKNYRGTCISIGENNGIHLSNVRALFLDGWSGVLVEPAPQVFKELQNLYGNREDVQCLNYAISDYNGKATLFDSGTHLQQGDTSLLSSLDEREIQKWKPRTDFNKVEVDVIDFKTLLELSKYKVFEMISCDAEGLDYNILKQMDLVELQCQFLIVEFNGKDKEKFDELVLPQGLHLIHQNSENLIYAV